MSDNKILPAIILAAGIASGAALLGAQFKNLRQPGTITVKGLAEAQHNATLGTWRVGVETWGQDYAAALAANKKNLAKLKDFLKQQGFPDGWCPKKYAAYFLIVFHYIYLHIGTPSQKP